MLSIDAFRGLTITAMVFVNTVGGFANTPAWSKHAHDFGLTYVDLVAPFFIFAIGLTYHLSFTKHLAQEGALEAYLRSIRRYFALIGIGFAGSMWFTPTGVLFVWNVLQAIGLAGFLTLFFIRFPQWARFVGAGILMIAYQIALPMSIEIEGVQVVLGDLIFEDVHGGLLGGIGWGAMMLLSTAIAESLEKNRMQDFLILGVALTLGGAIIHAVWAATGFPGQWGISKERVTLSYILVSVGLGSLVFYALWVLYDKKNLTNGSSRFFRPQGRNAFFLYIFHGFFIGTAWLYLNDGSHVGLVVMAGLINVTVVWVIGYLLDKRDIYIVI